MNEKPVKLYLISLLFFAICSFTGYTQEIRSLHGWQQGCVELVNHTKLTGEVRYDLLHESVQVKQQGTVSTIFASKIARFQLTDSARRNRVFYTLPYKNNYHFFELEVESDSIALLSREVENYRVNHNIIGMPDYKQQQIQKAYYLAHEEQGITFLYCLEPSVQKKSRQARQAINDLLGKNNPITGVAESRDFELGKAKDIRQIIRKIDQYLAEIVANAP